MKVKVGDCVGEECTGLGVLVPQPATGTAHPGAASTQPALCEQRRWGAGRAPPQAQEVEELYKLRCLQDRGSRWLPDCLQFAL